MNNYKYFFANRNTIPCIPQSPASMKSHALVFLRNVVFSTISPRGGAGAGVSNEEKPSLPESQGESEGELIGGYRVPSMGHA